jgi:hypothetical protein
MSYEGSPVSHGENPQVDPRAAIISNGLEIYYSAVNSNDLDASAAAMYELQALREQALILFGEEWVSTYLAFPPLTTG